MRRHKPDPHWLQCEIETAPLTDLQKDMAWDIKQVTYPCDAECWPGACSCARESAKIASKFTGELA